MTEPFGDWEHTLAMGGGHARSLNAALPVRSFGLPNSPTSEVGPQASRPPNRGCKPVQTES